MGRYGEEAEQAEERGGLFRGVEVWGKLAWMNKSTCIIYQFKGISCKPAVRLQETATSWAEWGQG